MTSDFPDFLDINPMRLHPDTFLVGHGFVVASVPCPVHPVVLMVAVVIGTPRLSPSREVVREAIRRWVRCSWRPSFVDAGADDGRPHPQLVVARWERLAPFPPASDVSDVSDTSDVSEPEPSDAPTSDGQDGGAGGRRGSGSGSGSGGGHLIDEALRLGLMPLSPTGAPTAPSSPMRVCVRSDGARLELFRFQPFQSRQGVDTVLGLRFPYEPTLIESLKQALRQATADGRNRGILSATAQSGGWLPERRCWFVESFAWPTVRDVLRRFGYPAPGTA